MALPGIYYINARRDDPNNLSNLFHGVTLEIRATGGTNASSYQFNIIRISDGKQVVPPNATIPYEPSWSLFNRDGSALYIEAIKQDEFPEAAAWFFDPNEAYRVTAKVTNSEGTVYLTYIIPSCFTYLDFSPEGGVAIGGISQDNKFNILMDTTITGDFSVLGSSVISLPSGSLYGTSLYTGATNANKVQTDSIADLAVTDAKINTVSSTKLTGTIDVARFEITTDANKIPTDAIKNLAITDAKIAANTITVSKLKTKYYSGVGNVSITTGTNNGTATVSPTIDGTPTSVNVVICSNYQGSAYSRPLYESSQPTASPWSFSVRVRLGENTSSTTSFAFTWIAIANYA